MPEPVPQKLPRLSQEDANELDSASEDSHLVPRSKAPLDSPEPATVRDSSALQAQRGLGRSCLYTTGFGLLCFVLGALWSTGEQAWRQRAGTPTLTLTNVNARSSVLASGQSAHTTGGSETWTATAQTSGQEARSGTGSNIHISASSIGAADATRGSSGNINLGSSISSGGADIAVTTTSAAVASTVIPEMPTATSAVRSSMPALSTGASATDSSSTTPNIEQALACLRMTTPSLGDFVYPSDAEAHFLEVNRSASKHLKRHKYHCAAGYCGPWVENYWIHYFSALWNNRGPGTRLHDIFGPYIPILVPWVDVWVNSGYHFPPGIIEDVRRVLRPNALYITVAQNDEGLLARHKLKMADIPNVLVLSAGGYGHVPLPLLKATEPLINSEFTSRKYFVSYMGSFGHAPKGMRGTMKARVMEWAKKSKLNIKLDTADNWRHVMADTKVSLTPRGFGRSAYHIAETIQMGFVPIYVWMDTPWIPYEELWTEEKIGFMTDCNGLKDLLTRIAANESRLLQMEQRIRSLRESHFLPEGVMDQISRFMTGRSGGGDLRCQKLPNSIRDA
eukprot:TRINITY_DN45184_c0_g1_i1.p1 TRINITY_DN45184_c0_g1~~TRINITY_DN45184_c0_g1_i1.p1  ORF type:complete len:563 (-),score=77.26 TRINITY_DN45184_c0_g1_i1:155-1843(-)